MEKDADGFYTPIDPGPTSLLVSDIPSDGEVPLAAAPKTPAVLDPPVSEKPPGQVEGDLVNSTFEVVVSSQLPVVILARSQTSASDHPSGSASRSQFPSVQREDLRRTRPVRLSPIGPSYFL